jgi:membrane fusion protein, multidrug efflux system
LRTNARARAFLTWLSGLNTHTNVARVGCVLLVACALCVACGTPPPPAEPPPVEVKVMLVVQRDTAVSVERVGDVRGSQEVDVRARVGGVVMKKHFTDGTYVKEGQVLFTIDPREFLAARADARARLAEAQANLAQANQEVERYRPLVEANAIPKQTYDTAVTTAQQSSARVDALEAAVTQADLSVEYATVRAPLSGHIGEAQVFEGALVLAGQTLLATISRDDPAWVYFSISETALLEAERRFLEGLARPRSARTTLSDGTPYPHEGRINFADRAVDPRTGTMTLRAEFPNPDRVLKPGMFVRTRVVAETIPNALLVPDVAVQEQLGRNFVIVVGEGDKAEQRAVTLGPRVEGQWVIEKGLSAGERVVVEGLQKARPGTPLKPTIVTAVASA